MTLLKTIIFTIFVPGTVTILIPFWLLSNRSSTPSAGFLKYPGLCLLLIGLLIYLWCAWDFTFAGKGTPAPIDPPKDLVVKGLYKYVRNPMYIGVLSILLGEAIFFRSRILLQYAIVVFIFFYLFVVLFEEQALKRKFGESYQRYCDTVPRWLPVRFRT